MTVPTRYWGKYDSSVSLDITSREFTKAVGTKDMVVKAEVWLSCYLRSPPEDWNSFEFGLNQMGAIK